MPASSARMLLGRDCCACRPQPAPPSGLRLGWRVGLLARLAAVHFPPDSQPPGPVTVLFIDTSRGADPARASKLYSQQPPAQTTGSGLFTTVADEAILACAKNLAKEYKNYTYGTGPNKIDCVHFVLNVVGR